MKLLKKIRKTNLLANAMGIMPKKQVAAPSMTDEPTSPSAFAIWTCFELSGLRFVVKKIRIDSRSDVRGWLYGDGVGELG